MLLSQPPTQQKIVDSIGNMAQTWVLFFTSLSKITGTVDLTPSASSTVVQNKNVTSESIVVLTPNTANAAVDAASGALYVVSDDGQFTIFHDNNVSTGRTFSYLVTK